MTKLEWQRPGFVNSDFVIVSSFVIRASSLFSFRAERDHRQFSFGAEGGDRVCLGSAQRG
jgi:hypothetical protein